MTLEGYLSGHLRPSTAERYMRDIRQYLGETPGAGHATYADIIRYLEKLRKRYPNKGTASRMLHSIKKYYEYLHRTGQVPSNPATNIHLKNLPSKEVRFTGLFSTKELESLLAVRWPRKSMSLRNKLIVSLLVYQAPMRQELAMLRTCDVDFENATIKIPGTAVTNARELPLHPLQVMVLYRYIHEERGRPGNDHGLLLTDRHGRPISGDAIRRLLRHCKGQFPGKSPTATAIRQSAIANKLKEGMGLRQVQVFAGHKYPSTTERYKQPETERLKAEVDKCHPLDRGA